MKLYHFLLAGALLSAAAFALGVHLHNFDLNQLRYYHWWNFAFVWINLLAAYKNRPKFDPKDSPLDYKV